MDKIAFSFSLFGKTIDVAWYAICVTGGMLCALGLLMYLMVRKKDEFIIDDALEVFLFAVPFAVIFARLGYVIPRWGTDFNTFGEIFGITSAGDPAKLAGLTIVVGIPGGALGIFLYCLLRKKSFFRVLDILVPCLLLGQVIGRWGNFVNQELYGLEITNQALQFFPFGVFINADQTWHCANFFYESFLNFIALVVVLVLMFKYSNKMKVGTITIGYVVWYGILRGLLEFVKIDQMKVGGIGVIQIICFIMAAIGIVLMVLLQKGIIKLETENMKKKHFITASVNDEIMSNNNDYDVKKTVVIRDESEEENNVEDSNIQEEIDSNE